MARVRDGFLLLEEAAALADAAYSDDTARAEALGWVPLSEDEIGPVPNFEAGVQETTVGTEWGEKFETAAHVYLGEAEGLTTLALAFRGTDQGGRELLFEVGQLDEYYDEHRELVEAALRFAREGLRDGSVDQVLIIGHSLGGILAEEAAALGLDDPIVRRNTTVATFGSPGSPEEAASRVRLLNVVHADDPVADIGDIADDLPGWVEDLLPGEFDRALDALDREGRDVMVRRPEGRPIRPGDIDEVVEVLYESDDWQEHRFLVEHDLDLYVQTAAKLEGAVA